MKKGKYLIQKITFVLLPILMVGQSINNFDVEPDPGYWGVENSDNADPAPGDMAPWKHAKNVSYGIMASTVGIYLLLTMASN